MKKYLMIPVFVCISLLVSSQNKPVIEWADIPAGNFMMGSPADEPSRDDAEIQHQVTLNAFKMSKYEITFDQYDAFCKATGREKSGDNGWGRGKRPVINISWEDANTFAAWMGCRLPTEAEWEYACRAATTSPFNTGNNLTTDQANYNGEYPYNGNPTGKNKGKTMPVGSYAPNAWGLYDMHGNVWEWCSDWTNTYTADAQTNPTGPESGLYKVRRGGSFDSYAQSCRSAKSTDYFPNKRSKEIGFRLVTQ